MRSPAGRARHWPMGARITLAFVAVLAVALTLAGGVSLYLVRHAAADNTRRLVLAQTIDLAAGASRHCTRRTRTPRRSSRRRPAPQLRRGDQAGRHRHDLRSGRLRQRRSAARLLGPGDRREGPHGRAHDLGHRRNLAFAAVPLISADGVHLSFLLARRSRTRTRASGTSSSPAGSRSSSPPPRRRCLPARRAPRRRGGRCRRRRIAGGDFSTRRRGVTPRLRRAGRLLSAALNQMAARLEDLRDLDRQFLLSVSHDLRTPLTSIRGYAEAIAEGVTPDTARAASVVVAEAIRLERLIGDLLDLARLDAHQFSLQLARLDAGAVVAEAAEALRYEFDAAGVALDVQVADGSWVEADADRLGQIVTNLAGERARSSPRPRSWFRARPPPERLQSRSPTTARGSTRRTSGTSSSAISARAGIPLAPPGRGSVSPSSPNSSRRCGGSSR